MGYIYDSQTKKCVAYEYRPDDFFEWVRYYSRRIQFNGVEITKAPWVVLFFGIAAMLLVITAALLHYCFVRRLNTMNVIEALVVSTK